MLQADQIVDEENEKTTFGAVISISLHRDFVSSSEEDKAEIRIEDGVEVTFQVIQNLAIYGT